MPTLRSLAAALLVLAAACSAPPPPGAPLEVATIAGRWRADGIRLDITDDGTVHYKRERGTRTELSGLIPDPDEPRPSGSGINSLPSRAARLPLPFARVRACARGAGGNGRGSEITGITLTNLTTTGFDAGAFGLGSHFVIDALPAVVDGKVVMTIDGAVLTKTAP